jgi:hypothetical protein
VFDYIEGFYNRVRRHSHLDQLSPMVFEQLRTGGEICLLKRAKSTPAGHRICGQNAIKSGAHSLAFKLALIYCDAVIGALEA